MADFGLDSLVDNANITKSLAGFRRRILSIIEGFFGINNPFGDAATRETGTGPGNTIKTDESGNIDSSITAVSGSGVTTFIPKVEEIGYGPYADNVQYVEEYDPDTQTMTCIFKVFKQGQAPPPTGTPTGVPTAAEIPNLDDIPLSLGVDFNTTETLTVDTRIPIETLTVVNSNSDAVDVDIRGAARNWTIRVTGKQANSFSAMTFTATTAENVTSTKFMRVDVRQEITPGVVPRIVGLQDNYTFRPGETARNDWTVTPATAVVRIDDAPDPGFVDYSNLDTTGITWRAVAPADNGTGSRRAQIVAVNGALRTRYYVDFDVIGSQDDDNDAGGGIIV